MPIAANTLWTEQLPRSLAREPLRQPLEVDVAIIGAGFTGLWTAYFLKRQAPHLRIAVFEQQTVGFGASGRNGGWLLGCLLGEEQFLAGVGPAQKAALRALLKGIPDRVFEVLQREGIECGFRKGGVLTCAARYPEQHQHLCEELRRLHAAGHSEADYRYLTASELSEQVRMAGAYGAIYSPHCATVQPAQLVSGLAAAVERLGVSVYEYSRVEQWRSGQLTVAGHSVQAGWVVPCVEGHAADCPPLGRYQLAVQSLQIATEPMAAAQWDEIGLADGQAAHECSRQVTYFHRTRDDRLVFGARGSYRFGGRLRENFQLSADELSYRRRLLLELFPQLTGVPISHGWGGNLGMTRHFRPYMLCDTSSGFASAGGYGGEGVGASFLAGQTLADLILQRDTLCTHAPWVTRQQNLSKTLRRWEPEPLRWLGYNAVIAAFTVEDNVLANPTSAPWRRRLVSAVAGGVSALVSPEFKAG
ncbi:NAD(P)/FAD-dependent oxidoreductase [Pseudomonas turukhanskensis]|uniref:FAD dependent oxidoreductase domain-containing protein n=1 Tax=Pseudomonas turukhanskensis TaxID=1806536 RepID=A0A9W6K459_9PSED|nr:FAD-dependent oxidoreductase [Pseudomonas turukhanskensis]GLK88457.1 hypothetical protein GCM10017655_15190 [Pseudomonas turukhanskensis]